MRCIITHSPTLRQCLTWVAIGPCRIHSLICRAFGVPAPTIDHTTDHIDNNPSNNNVENLRWASPAEQIKHSYATNLERKSSADRQSKPVQGRKVGNDE